MFSEYFKNRSTEQLKSEVKKTRNVLIVVIILLSLLMCFCFYKLIENNQKPLYISILVVSLFCFGALVHQFKFIRKAKKEIEIRKNRTKNPK